MDKNTNKKDVIDVKYEEEEPQMYLSLPEVANYLNESESALRYWCDCFKDFLHIKTEGRKRKLNKENIKILQDIQNKRRNDNYTVNQTYHYLGKKYGNEKVKVLDKKPVDNNEIFTQAIANLLSTEINKSINKSLDTMTNKIIQNITSSLEKQTELNIQNKDELKKYIKDTFANHTDEVKTILDNKELEATKKDNEIINLLKENMKKRQEEYEKEKDKSFFSRIFHKK